ncbi:hypothetical protein FKW77_007446 [Venturia effusa]|uniref:Uncharacterized protein n=1 Tax=Venturia effusa TaxID=50376 RepID=A0A517LKI4_9PEZI|nr:hypothetical protein FKW77_007446 [Venturia effusa]
MRDYRDISATMNGTNLTTTSTLSTTSSSSLSSTLSATQFIGVFIAGTPLCLVVPTTLSGTAYGTDGLKTYLGPNDEPYVTAIQSNGIVPAVLGASICRGSSGYSSTMINTAALPGATEVVPDSSVFYPPSVSNENGISPGAIAGIVVGVLVVPLFALLGMCIFVEKRRRENYEEMMEDEKNGKPHKERKVITTLVDIAEVAARKKGTKQGLQRTDNHGGQEQEMRGALRV